MEAIGGPPTCTVIISRTISKTSKRFSVPYRGDPKPARADSRWLLETAYEPTGSEKTGISRSPR